MLAARIALETYVIFSHSGHQTSPSVRYPRCLFRCPRRRRPEADRRAFAGGGGTDVICQNGESLVSITCAGAGCCGENLNFPRGEVAQVRLCADMSAFLVAGSTGTSSIGLEQRSSLTVDKSMSLHWSVLFLRRDPRKPLFITELGEPYDI